MSYFDRQKREAKENYTYFFIKMIFSIFKIFLKLSIALLISGILNYTIISIITLLFTLYSFYNIFDVYYYYHDIMNEIKTTINSDITLEIDFNKIKFSIFKGMVKYGK